MLHGQCNIMIEQIKNFVKIRRKQLFVGLIIFLLVLFAFSVGYIVGAKIFSKACIVIQKGI